MEGWAVEHPNLEPSLEPPASRSIRDVLRDWMRIPDPDIGWARRASRAAIDLGRRWRPDWVITSAPPESVHAAGATVRRALRCAWLADFRDSWLQYPLLGVRSIPARAMADRLWARLILPGADLLTATDHYVLDEMIRLGGRAERAFILPQAADPPAFSEGKTLSKDSRHVVHVGSFTLSDPNRRIESLLELFDAAAARRNDLQLHLIGRLTIQEQLAANRALARSAIFDHGVLDAEAARALQREADLGAVVCAPGTHAVPGKLYEYAAAGLPVVLVGAPQWAEALGWDNRDPLAVLTGQSPPLRLAAPPTAEQLGVELLKRMSYSAA